MSDALVNLGVIALVAIALFFTKSLWAFIGLIFMPALRTAKIKTSCPKCGYEFTAVKKESKEDEEDEDK